MLAIVLIAPCDDLAQIERFPAAGAIEPAAGEEFGEGLKVGDGRWSLHDSCKPYVPVILFVGGVFALEDRRDR